MPKYIKKKDLKNAIDECTWYHIGKGGELVEGANSSEHEPLYKYSDIKEIIKNLPTRKFENEPKRTALSKALKWTYGDEPNSSEKPNNSTISKMEQVEYEPQAEAVTNYNHLDNVLTFIADKYQTTKEDLLDGLIKDEPQTEDERVREVVRGFMSIVNDMRNPTEEERESVNKYIESISKPTGVNIFDLMDEPQTDCPWK